MGHGKLGIENNKFPPRLRAGLEGTTTTNKGPAAMRIETCYFCSSPVYPSKGITFVRVRAPAASACPPQCQLTRARRTMLAPSASARASATRTSRCALPAGPPHTHACIHMCIQTCIHTPKHTYIHTHAWQLTPHRKRNPRKLAWTKSFRRAHGKEMTVDSTLAFAARRNIPTRYNRDLVQTTLKAMSRVSEIRARRERAFYKARMRGNKERQRADDRKLVDENQHLLPPSERYAVAAVETEGMDVDVDAVKAKVKARRKELEDDELSGEELEVPKTKVKSKRKLKMKVGGGTEAMDVDG